MATLISNNDKLFEGFNNVCSAVSRTLGSEGKLAVLENPDGIQPPIVTKDGVSVAKHITETDRVRSLGNRLAKQASARTLLEAGDNTTTTLVLAQALTNSIKSDDFNKKVEMGFDIAHEEAQRLLKRYSKKVNPAVLKSIATVATNNNKELGELIADAYTEAGGDQGFITYTKNYKLPKTRMTVTDGFKLNRGLSHPSCVNDQNRGIFDSTLNDKPTVVISYIGWHPEDSIVDKYIRTNYKTKNIVLVLERSPNSKLIDLAHQITLHKGSLLITEMASNLTESEREQILRDIAMFTGGEVFVQGKSTELLPGTVSSVRADNSYTTIVPNLKAPGVDEELEKINKRLAEIESGDNTTNGISEHFLKYRKSMLGGKSVNIEVGGDNDIMVNEIFDRVDDAVRAVDTAMDGGYVAGGGSTFAHIYAKMNSSFDNKDVQHGYDTFKEALLAPMKTICKNSRRDAEAHLYRAFQDYGFGYNGTKDETSNLVKDKILDSKKGLSVALKNAKSTAVLMLSIDVISIITNENEAWSDS